MWAFVAVARIEARFDRWIALVRLSADGVESSQFFDYRQQPTDVQVQADAQAMVDAWNERDAASELALMVLQDVWRAPQFQTGVQLATRFRTAYQAATQTQAYQMAYWIINRIASGDLTDTQVRNAFGLNTTQYTALKSRFQARHDTWVSVLTAVGE